MPVACEHGIAYHDGTVPSAVSAPEKSRAWLLVEHLGPWPAEPLEAALAPRLRTLATSADALGIRVQLIRRPGRRTGWQPGHPVTVFAGWTAGDTPWLRRGAIGRGDTVDLDLEAVASGRQPSFGVPVTEPVYLVCTHARRNACCGRFGLPLASALAQKYPAQVWESSHVGGHKYAANLVLLPHGHYYGPVQVDGAVAAIEAYRTGGISPDRYRGRAGQPRDEQQAEYTRLTESTHP
ncbi:MAG TPA: sucrase ferredoxin [Streptosporangiaceae bacterium]|nr:sucrase ferredoxin [Streptosporangiaceae bacterium]